VEVAQDVVFGEAEALESEEAAPGLCQPLFHFQLPSNGPMRTPVVAGDGTVYLASGDQVAAVKPSGTARWQVTVDAGATLGELAWLGEDLFLGSSAGLLHRLRLADGEEAWGLDLKQPGQAEPISHAPLRVGDALAAAGAGGVFLVAEQTPVKAFVRAFRELAGPPFQPIVVGERLVVAAGNTLYALDSQGAGEGFPLFVEGDGEVTSQPVALDANHVVLGARWGDKKATRGLVLAILDAGSSNRLPYASLAGAPRQLLAVSDHEVWGTTESGEGFRFDLDAGTGKRFVAGGDAIGYPVRGDDGVTCLAASSGGQVTVSARDDQGVERWSDQVPGSHPGGLALRGDGTLLVPSDLTLHAWRCAATGLDAVPWPKFQRDPLNTGVFQ
jgi:hypothetical protein